MARTQSVSDLSADPPGPAEELRVVDMLDIVHAEHSGFAAVETPKHRSRRVKDIRFFIHQLPDVFENETVSELVEASAANERCCPAHPSPQRKQAVVNNTNLEIIA